MQGTSGRAEAQEKGGEHEDGNRGSDNARWKRAPLRAVRCDVHGIRRLRRSHQVHKFLFSFLHFELLRIKEKQGAKSHELSWSRFLLSCLSLEVPSTIMMLWL